MTIIGNRETRNEKQTTCKFLAAKNLVGPVRVQLFTDEPGHFQGSIIERLDRWQRLEIPVRVTALSAVLRQLAAYPGFPDVTTERVATLADQTARIFLIDIIGHLVHSPFIRLLSPFFQDSRLLAWYVHCCQRIQYMIILVVRFTSSKICKLLKIRFVYELRFHQKHNLTNSLYSTYRIEYTVNAYQVVPMMIGIRGAKYTSFFGTFFLGLRDLGVTA